MFGAPTAVDEGVQVVPPSEVPVNAKEAVPASTAAPASTVVIVGVVHAGQQRVRKPGDLDREHGAGRHADRVERVGEGGPGQRRAPAVDGAGLTVPTLGEPPVPEGTVMVTSDSVDVLAAISVYV